MKKIYSFIKGSVLVASLSLSFISSAQPICGPVAESFDNTNSAMGFFGDFTIGGSNPDRHLEKNSVLASGIYTITTPTYQLANNATFVGFGFMLSGTERVARAEAAIVYISTLNNQMTTVFLAQFVPSYDMSTNPPAADICRVVALSELPGFPVGGKYRLRFELTPNTGSGQASQTINFDDFRTNGSLSQAPLPVNFIGFEAKKTSAGVQLTWKVAGEENVAHYEVERSTDGRNFTSVTTVATVKKDTYSYLDATNNSTVYYRIKNVDNDGRYKYSSIARIVNGKMDIVIKAFPQPVLSQLTVQHPTIKDNSLLTISTADGRLVKSIRPAVGSMQTLVDMNNIQKGMYLVRFDDGSGAIETIKVVKQ